MIRIFVVSVYLSLFSPLAGHADDGGRHQQQLNSIKKMYANAKQQTSVFLIAREGLNKSLATIVKPHLTYEKAISLAREGKRAQIISPNQNLQYTHIGLAHYTKPTPEDRRKHSPNDISYWGNVVVFHTLHHYGGYVQLHINSLKAFVNGSLRNTKIGVSKIEGGYHQAYLKWIITRPEKREPFLGLSYNAFANPLSREGVQNSTIWPLCVLMSSHLKNVTDWRSCRDALEELNYKTTLMFIDHPQLKNWGALFDIFRTTYDLSKQAGHSVSLYSVSTALSTRLFLQKLKFPFRFL